MTVSATLPGGSRPTCTHMYIHIPNNPSTLTHVPHMHASIQPRAHTRARKKLIRFAPHMRANMEHTKSTCAVQETRMCSLTRPAGRMGDCHHTRTHIHHHSPELSPSYMLSTQIAHRGGGCAA